MSLLNQASLVVVPSGYKAGTVYSAKPINGDGDLSFTRSNDTATRVNSDGLIEKVRTNLLLQSNSFNITGWGISNATLTSGQSGYDGTNDAYLIDSNSEGYVFQYASVVLGTFSVYAKANSVNNLRLRCIGASNSEGFFDLQNGIKGTSINLIDSKIEDIGNGWYRCSITMDGTPTLIRIYPSVSSSTSSGTIGSIYIQDAQLESGDIATDYIPTTSAAVSVGMTANVPRLDYSGGGCPKLLLESQRTNVVLYSEQFDNAAWTKTSCTITANDTTAPDGYTSADRITITSTGQSLVQSPTLTSGQPFVFSVFVKEGNWGIIRIGNVSSGTAGAWFNVTNGTAGTINGGTSEIIDYGNGWYRLIAKFTSFTTGISFIALSDSDGSTTTSAIDTFMYLWGAQLEAGSYVSSYINTLSAVSTRGADAAELNPSTLLGATTGSWYIEIDDLTFQVITTTVPTNYIGDNTSNLLGYEARASNNKTIYFVKEESNVVNTLYSFTPTTKHKACFVWNGTTLKLFVDGVKRYDAGGFTQPANWDELKFNSSSREAQQTINQTILFPTALTDTQAIELTTL